MHTLDGTARGCAKALGHSYGGAKIGLCRTAHEVLQAALMPHRGWLRPSCSSDTCERAASVVDVHLQGARAFRLHRDGTPRGCEEEADCGWRVMRLLPLLPPTTPKLVTAALPLAPELPAMTGIACNAAPTISHLPVQSLH